MNKFYIYLDLLKWMVTKLSGLTLFSSALIAMDVNAQQTSTDRIIQQEQQRQEQQFESFTPEQAPKKALKRKSELKAQTDEQACIDIQIIEFEGAKLFVSNKASRQITKEYQGKCITVVDINNILTQVTDFYYERGYVTSRAYVPEQDMSTGTLKILVIESQISSLELNKSNNKTNRYELITAFPTRKGDHLNLRNLEQGLDQINRLGSNNATMEMIPGESPGLSNVVISNDVRKRYRFNLGFDNSGQVGTGEFQHKLGFTYDNLFGVNDFLAINGQTDANGDGEEGLSRSASLLYEVPLGYWTTEISLSYFEYAQEVEGFISAFQTDGTSESQAISVKRLVHRDNLSKTSLGLKLQHKENENFVEDTLVETSSRELTIASLDLTHIRRLFGGRAVFGIGYQKGLDTLGALDDSDREITDEIPLAQFEKVTASFQYQRPIKVFNRAAFYSLSANGQYSDDILFSTEQLSIGGQFSVNGFKDDGLSGRSGGFIRQTFGLPVFNNNNVFARWTGNPQFTFGIDIGSVRTDDPSLDTYTSLTSASIGLSGRISKFNYSFTYAEPISEPDFIFTEGREIYFSLNFGL